MTSTLPTHGKTVATIDVGQLRQLLANGSSVRLLDVRTAGEFETGNIEGSVNIPLDRLSAVAASLDDPAAGTLVVICQSGSRAASACEVLISAGVPAPVLLNGGMNSWQAAGGASRKLSNRWSLERQVRFAAGGMVLAGVLVSIAWPPARFFSGAIGAGLVFASVTNTCAMGMLLAKLPFNRGSDTCSVQDSVARLKS